MADEEKIVRYTARDGTDVSLSPHDVVSYMCSGRVKPSEADVAMIIATCAARGFNPLAGDCTVSVFKNRDGTTRASVMPSRDYWERAASTEPTYRGKEAGIVVVDLGGQIAYRVGALVIPGERLLGGWCEVRDSRWERPLRHEVSLEEYDQGNSMWESKPATMIRKVAISQALREAYPGALGGTYDASEYPDHEEGEEVEAEYEAG